MYETSPYDNPQNVGLEIVAVLQQPDLSYEFYMLLVVRHKDTGRLFYAEDAGCSCPAPFENETFSGPDDTTLMEIVPETLSEFERHVRDFPADDADKSDLLRKVRTALGSR